jgi:hypothetical protein
VVEQLPIPLSYKRRMQLGENKGLPTTGQTDINVLVGPPLLGRCLEHYGDIKVLAGVIRLIVLPSKRSSTPMGVQGAGLPSMANATEIESRWAESAPIHESIYVAGQKP